VAVPETRKHLTAKTQPHPRPTPANPASTNATADKALDLIGASDCTTCHRLHKSEGGSTIGPAYSESRGKIQSRR